MLLTIIILMFAKKLNKVYIFHSHEILAALPAQNIHIYYPIPYRNSIHLNKSTVMILLQMKIAHERRKVFHLRLWMFIYVAEHN